MGEFNRYNKKYGLLSIDIVQEVIHHGVCLRQVFHRQNITNDCEWASVELAPTPPPDSYISDYFVLPSFYLTILLSHRHSKIHNNPTSTYPQKT